MKHHSRLDHLMMAINRWLELPRVSRSIVANEIVQTVARLDLKEKLELEGISFNYSDDLYNDSRVNAQKIFRWLGQYEGLHAFPDRLFFLEQAILAAMPKHLRLSYLNEVYGMVGVTVVADHYGDAVVLKTADIAASLTKENSEAQIAIIRLGSDPTRDAVTEAYRELRESRGTTQAAMNLLEREFTYLQDKPLKAVGGHAVCGKK